MDIGTIIDIVLACIFCVSLVSGWHQGLVMKVASLIVVGVSYILAGILSKTISPYIADEISKNRGYECNRSVFIYSHIHDSFFCGKVYFQKAYQSIKNS